MTDERDTAILALLEADGRISNSEIARQLGLSESYIRQKLKKLFATSRIRRGMIVDFSILGLTSVWCVRLKFETKHVPAALEKLTKEEATGLVMSVFGEFDIFAIVVVKDAVEFTRFLDERVKSLEGFLSAHPTLISDAVKYDANKAPLRLLG